MAGKGAYSADCAANPDFCAATHVFVPYCTGDCHAGNNTSPSASSWELYFDGHANFAAIIAELKQQHGLAAAKKVLLTGGSAGGIGTFKNVDFLATLLPGAVVKGAPEAGWFFPAALPTDLPNIYRPSDCMGALRQRNARQPLVCEQLTGCLCSRGAVAVARTLSACVCGAAKAKRVVGLRLD